MYVILVGVCHLAGVPRVEPPLETTRREIRCVHISGFESDGGDESWRATGGWLGEAGGTELESLGVGFPLTPKCLPFGRPQNDLGNNSDAHIQF
jgi:hypothetical protein